MLRQAFVDASPTSGRYELRDLMNFATAYEICDDPKSVFKAEEEQRLAKEEAARDNEEPETDGGID